MKDVFKIRIAEEKDAGTILNFIKELAVYVLASAASVNDKLSQIHSLKVYFIYIDYNRVI